MSTTIDPTSLDDAAERLGLIGLETAVLGVVAAPELDARFARLRPSPRVVATLLGSAPPRSPRSSPAARSASGRVRSRSTGRCASRRGWPRSCCARRCPSRRCGRVDAPAVDPGREDEVARLAELAALRGRLPLVVLGPDAPALLARALTAG